MRFSRSIQRLALLAVCSAMVVLSGCASRQSLPEKPKSLSAPKKSVAPSAFIPERSRSVEPFAHVLFCTKDPGECRASGGPASVDLTPARQAQLQAVNDRVNSEIRPSSDSDRDVWTLWPNSGDCEDYAVTKRHELISTGWPASALRLAVGYTAKGEGHMVLVARTSHGDLVLNNLTDEIRSWRNAGIRWQSMQSSENPRIWQRI